MSGLPAINPFEKPKRKYLEYDTLNSFLKEILTRKLNAVLYAIPGYITTYALVRKSPARNLLASLGGISSSLVGDYVGLKKFEKDMYGKHLSGGTQYLKRVTYNIIPSLFNLPGHLVGDYMISRKLLNKNFRPPRIKKRSG